MKDNRRRSEARICLLKPIKLASSSHLLLRLSDFHDRAGGYVAAEIRQGISEGVTPQQGAGIGHGVASHGSAVAHDGTKFSNAAVVLLSLEEFESGYS